MTLKDKWKKFWYTPPGIYELFFVYIRQLYQSLFKCKHKWVYNNKYIRTCLWCNKKQLKGYKLKGNKLKCTKRNVWVDFPTSFYN